MTKKSYNPGVPRQASVPAAPGIDPEATIERKEKATGEMRRMAAGGFMGNLLYGLKRPLLDQAPPPEYRRTLA